MEEMAVDVVLENPSCCPSFIWISLTTSGESSCD